MLPPEEIHKSRAAARAKAWCLICFGLGLLLTNYPLLQIFNQPTSLGGIPTMVVYLTGIWLVGIFVLFRLTRVLGHYSDKD
ncbi:MAG: hypothetical protein FJ135_09210 [Deltaproteobacteria bacterium]|nr:hypothetical protein [Deltaproteobacteria bacterium]